MTAHDEPEPPGALSGIAMFCGVFGVFGVATVKFLPIGFALAVPGLVLSVLALGASVMRGRSPRLAVAALFCCVGALVFWGFVHEHANPMFGRAFWPDWLL